MCAICSSLFVFPFFSPGGGVLRKVPAPSLGGGGKGAGDRTRWVRCGELLGDVESDRVGAVWCLGTNQPLKYTTPSALMPTHLCRIGA